MALSRSRADTAKAEEEGVVREEEAEVVKVVGDVGAVVAEAVKASEVEGAEVVVAESEVKEVVADLGSLEVTKARSSRENIDDGSKHRPMFISDQLHKSQSQTLWIINFVDRRP